MIEWANFISRTSSASTFHDEVISRHASDISFSGGYYNEKSYDAESKDNIREVCNKHLEQFGLRNISGVRIETMTSNIRFSNFVIAVYREKCYSNYKGE